MKIGVECHMSSIWDKYLNGWCKSQILIQNCIWHYFEIWKISLCYHCICFLFVLLLPILFYLRTEVNVLTSKQFLWCSNPVYIRQLNEQPYLWSLIAGPESIEPILIFRRGAVVSYRKIRNKKKEKKNFCVFGFSESIGPYDYTNCLQVVRAMLCTSASVDLVIDASYLSARLLRLGFSVEVEAVCLLLQYINLTYWLFASSTLLTTVNLSPYMWNQERWFEIKMNINHPSHRWPLAVILSE